MLLLLACASPSVTDCQLACDLVFTEAGCNAFVNDDSLPMCYAECSAAEAPEEWSACIVNAECGAISSQCGASPCTNGPEMMWPHEDPWTCDG